MAKKLLTTLTLMASMTAGAAFAGGHIEGAIKARQGQMQLYGLDCHARNQRRTLYGLYGHSHRNALALAC